MEQENQQAKSPSDHGKKPWWLWILICIVVGIIAYTLVYYLFFGENAEYAKNPQNYQAAVNKSEIISPNSSEQDQSQITNNNNFMIQNMNVEILQEGSGPEAKSGDMVTVNYTGTLQDGTKFDSSLNPGRTPFQFTLGQNRVIQGWELGVLGMKAGEKRKLTIPPELGYGPGGNPPVIPPNATLIFEVELLKIN